MVVRKKGDEDPENKAVRRPPATTPEGREQQLVAMAFDVAEKQMAKGTASSQVITHFLKLGTENARLEREKLRHETALLEARKDQLGKDDRMAELFDTALKAFRGYQGQEEEEQFDE